MRQAHVRQHQEQLQKLQIFQYQLVFGYMKHRQYSEDLPFILNIILHQRQQQVMGHVCVEGLQQQVDYGQEIQEL